MFILHFKEELSYIEIAQKLNISRCNARRRIYKARQILKQRYHQDYIGENQSKLEVVSQIDRNKESVTQTESANSKDIELPILESSNQVRRVKKGNSTSVHTKREVFL